MVSRDARESFYKEKVRRIRVANTKGHRAPHKPLLMLLILGQYLNGKRTICFSDICEPLTLMLSEFGPYRKTYYPNLPFIKLQNDGLWNITGDVEVDTLYKGGYSKRFLLDHHFEGRLEPDFERYLLEDRNHLLDMANFILETNFPVTIHQDILQIAQIDLFDTSERLVDLRQKRRDPHFREDVLIAYNYTCAVCGFELRLGRNPVGLEAAHIKWHAAGGDDVVNNGIALCSLHHKLFDLGVFTLNDQYEIALSDMINGKVDIIEKYRSHEIILPNREPPSFTNIHWHRNEVFKGIL